MAANLWRYRYHHTWYGDRRFSFTGSWKQIAWPYYLSYLFVVVVGAAGLLVGAGMGAFPGDIELFNPSSLLPLALAAALCGMGYLFYRSRELTRMFSAVRLGSAHLSVQVRARSLLGIYLLFGLALVGAYLVLLVGGSVVLGTVAGDAFAGGRFDMQLFLEHLQSSWATLVAVVLGYLLVFGAYIAMRDLFIGLGFWRLVAQGASISDLHSIANVQARGEDKALVGEGLADALNVGAY
jgi:uncharacterized membrane protein YjgN (DUF898 family)